MLNLILTENAHEAIAAIGQYIMTDNHDAAIKTMLKIYDSIETIVQAPLGGRKLKNKKIKDAELYSWLVKPYLVFYRFDEENLEILDVLDGRSDYIKKLDEKIRT